MAVKRITFKLPDELIQAIDSHTRATGKDRTAVVVQALQQVFASLTDELPPVTAVSGVASQEPELKKQAHEISKLKVQVSGLEEKANNLTEQIAELKEAKLPNSSLIQNIAFLSKHLANLVTEQPIAVQQVKPQTTEVLASYYVQIDNFLTKKERSRLFNYVLRQEAAFILTSTSTDQLNYRQSMALYSFPEFSKLIVNRVQAIIPDVLSKLGLPSFSVSQIETQLTAHNDGNYYKIHNDNGSPEVAARELSYVYYFYREPKPFSGGELLIYDSKIENNFYVAAESFKTVEPSNNSIVFFLSRYEHEVLPVSCPSKAFADSRFTINGWVRR